MSKSRWTAVDFIANAKRPSGYSAGDIVELGGWSTFGDGGAAQWVATGNQIAASQTPALLGFAKCSDSSGNEFELAPGVIDFRAIGCDNTTDLAAAQAGVNSGLHLRIASAITLEGPLKLNVEGTKITGGNSARVINGSAATGAIIEVLNRKIELTGFKLNAVSARLAANYDVEAMGILIGGAGQVSIPTNTVIEYLDILSNPGDGVYFAGDAVGSRVEQNNIQMNRGHGVRLDDGTSLGQSNLRAGTVAIQSNVIKNNGGYAVAQRPEGGGSVYRIDIDNNDIGDNCWNETEIGYAVDEHVLLNCQNGRLSLNAYNNDDFAGTTLNNGRNKYARAEPSSGVRVAGSGINDSITASNERMLLAKSGYVIDGNNVDIEINSPSAKGGVLTSMVSFNNSAAIMQNLNLDLNSTNTTSVLSGTLDAYHEYKIDGVDTVYIGTGSYTLGNKTFSTIAGGGARISSNIVSVIGEGDAADTLSFLLPGLGATPLRDGDSITIINENAYDITVQNSGADPSSGISPIKTQTGVNVILTTGQTFIGVVIDGFLRQT